MLRFPQYKVLFPCLKVNPTFSADRFTSLSSFIFQYFIFQSAAGEDSLQGLHLKPGSEHSSFFTSFLGSPPSLSLTPPHLLLVSSSSALPVSFSSTLAGVPCLSCWLFHLPLPLSLIDSLGFFLFPEQRILVKKDFLKLFIISTIYSSQISCSLLQIMKCHLGIINTPNL